MKAAFIGRRGLGGVTMRAAPTAKALGLPLVDCKDFSPSSFWDTLVVCKYWPDVDLKGRCGRLIWDPLDAWESTKPHAAPVEFWRWAHSKLRFDAIVATSPAAADTMRAALPDVEIIMSPHHADPRIEADWYDPDGPIVYAGGIRFIDSAIPALTEAARRLGRKFIVDTDRECWKSLKGAALSLCLRLPPCDGEINRTCKPTVKVENTAAAGLCCLASDHPSITSLRPEITVPRGSWESAILSALEAGPLKNPVRIEKHIDIMGKAIAP